MTYTAKINRIQDVSYVDGPGKRTVVFFQGCPIHCAGCQNRALWTFEGGRAVDAAELAADIAERAGIDGNVTISGGEPFAQPAALAELVLTLKFVYQVGHIIVYTGFEFDALLKQNLVSPWLYSIFTAVDVIVDGPFISSLDDDRITYRGSRNQRAIDVRATVLSREIVELNWDNPELVLTSNGEIVLPVGMAAEFEDMGVVRNTRMCGQTRGTKK